LLFEGLRQIWSFRQIMSFSYSVCILINQFEGWVLNCLNSRLERSSISARLRKCFGLSEFVIVLQLFFSDIFQVFLNLAEMTFLGIAGRQQENIRSTKPSIYLPTIFLHEPTYATYCATCAICDPHANMCDLLTGNNPISHRIPPSSNRN